MKQLTIDDYNDKGDFTADVTVKDMSADVNKMEAIPADYNDLKKEELIKVLEYNKKTFENYEHTINELKEGHAKEVNEINEYYKKRITELNSIISYYERKLKLINDIVNIERGNN